MFSKSKRFGDNVHAASGPGPAAYNIKRLFDASRAQQSNRVRKPQALPLRPVLLGNRPKNRNEPVKVNSKNAAADDSNWLKVFACKDWLATGATGMVFAGTLIAEETPAALKRIKHQEFDQKMVDEFFREFAILKALRHENIVTVFSAYEAPKPAFIMELLGKSLNQSTKEKAIDNNGVMVAFSNAAAAVQYLHSVSIAHRDIKPSNLCHQVDCHSWEVKLIDFDAAEKLEDYAETGPATPAYAPTSANVFEAFSVWKKWKMVELDIFALGKTFQEIVCERGSALTDPFKKDFLAVTDQLLIPKQNLQQALENAQAAGVRPKVP